MPRRPQPALVGEDDQLSAVAVAEFGVGLAAAVALDAFILRTVLVPAVMHMLGNANWSLPGWLDRRLPHLAIEPRKETPVEGTAGLVYCLLRGGGG